MKEMKPYLNKVSIYCYDLEKTISKDGCYDAKGSTICKVCSVKPSPKKVNVPNKGNKS